MRQPFASTLLVASLLAGCAGAGSTPPSDEPEPAEPRSGRVPEPLLERVLRQAADEAGVSGEAIEVVTAESVTWSDGSLGCPQPGHMYTQALVPGYRVVLRVAGAEVAYHASDSGDFRPCANPVPHAGGAADR
jgi:hypothetical protein